MDWTETLIAARDDGENDKLLFQNFIAAHPGLDHLGGAPRGGSFVLVYDDHGSVVADFALSYPWPETDGEEPEEPPLRRPPRLDVVVKDPVRVIPPFDVAISNFQQSIDNFKVNIQQGYLETFNKSINAVASVFGGKVNPPVAVTTPVSTGDPLADFHIAQVAEKQRHVDELKVILARPDLNEGVRADAMQLLQSTQSDLAGAITGAAQRMVDAKVDVSADTAGAQAVAILAGGVGRVTDVTAADKLRTGLNTVNQSASGAQQAMVGNLLRIGF
jgi:hypothetical protein